jgi:P4 family phage/plasmid primase-like protien
MQVLGHFLRSHARKGKSDPLPCTHTSMSGGSYNIPEGDDTKKMFALLGKIAADEDLSSAQRHALVERPRTNPDDISIFRMDIDIKYTEQCHVRSYTSNNIERLTKIAWRVLNKYLKLKRNVQQMFVFEKANPTPGKKAGEWRDGIHFMAPYIHIKNRTAHLLLRKIKDDMIKEGAMDNIYSTNEVGTMMDFSVIDESGWMLYGGSKPDGLTYRLTQIISHDMEQIPVDTYTNEELPKLLSIRMSKRSELAKYADDINDNEIMSQLNLTDSKKKSSQRKDEKERIKKRISSMKPAAKADRVDLKRAKKLAGMLNRKRADDYNSWIRVGWALHNIDYSLLDTWIEFSQRSKKFEEGACEDLWDDFKSEGFGVGSLYCWAKVDNPEAYQAFRSSEINDALLSGLSGASYDVAKVLFGMYGHTYVCTSPRAKTWREFRDHRWINIEEGYTLNMKISEELVNEYCKLAAYYYEEAVTKKGLEKEKSQDRADSVNALIKKLKSYKYKSEVMAECRNIFHQPGFENKLDENYRILGMANGVIDLSTMEFREGVPEDKCSLSTNNEFLEYDPDNPKIKWVLNFMEKLQPQKAVRKYLWRLLSSCLDGNNREEKFHLLTGKGCFAGDTEVLMADGTKRYVKDLKMGAELMGWDMQPRKVVQLIRNRGKMYRIDSETGSYQVSGDHKLVLRTPEMKGTQRPDGITVIEWIEYNDVDVGDSGEISMIPVFRTHEIDSDDDDDIKDFFNELGNRETVLNGSMVIVEAQEFYRWPKDVKSRMRGFHVSLELEESPIELDPEFVGLWTVRGSPATQKLEAARIPSRDEMSDELKLALDTYLEDGDITEDTYNTMGELGMFETPKRIPRNYMFNCREIRQKVLNAILRYGRQDAAGNLLFATRELSEDVALLARGIGYRVKTYCTNRNFVLELTDKWDGSEAIKIVEVDRENYFGFALSRTMETEDGEVEVIDDQSSKFLLVDLTVVSNSNGKSKLIALIQMALGDYADVVPPTMFTKKRGDSNGATPMQAKLKGRRAIFAQETEEDDKLAVGIIKEYSGNDVITVRPLYGVPISFKPQFRIFMICNKLPYVPSNDEGTWRRIRVVEFKAKFTDTPTRKGEHKLDSSLGEKLPMYADACLSILLNEYRAYKTEGLIEPDAVKVNTKQYRQVSDTIMEFVAENCEEKKKSKELIMTIFRMFQSWFKTSYGNTMRAPNKRDFQDYLESKNLTIEKGYVFGLRMKAEQFSDSEME